MLTIKKNEMKGITSFTTYESGEMKECRLNNYNLISTKYGDFVPQYKDPGIRKKELKSLSFYKSGAIKSISLEQQTNVITSIGIFPAELVTFFEDGSINSLFPLNGQIGFSWSEKEEGRLSQIFDFEFMFGKFSVKIIGLRFYKNEKVRSLILWPDEIITINTPLGEIPVRIGFKLFEDGTLESFEPAKPISVKTPIGSINAFDVNALAVDADENSLRFDRKGSLTSLVTSGDIIIIGKSNGKIKTISQKLRPGLLDDDFINMPLKLHFNQGSVIIDDGIDTVEYKIDECNFKILSDNSFGAKTCGGECSGCDGCT